MGVQMQNICAEEMLSFASKKTLKAAFDFSKEKIDGADFQIDLFYAWITSDSNLFDQEIYSDNLENFKSVLNNLDTQHVYFLLTATAGGAGHWQCLHFIDNRGWQLYSTPTNNIMLTSPQGNLIEKNARERLFGSITGTQKWGTAQGERSIWIRTATPQRIILGANYVCIARTTKGTEEERKAAALEYTCKNSNPELISSPYIKPSASVENAVKNTEFAEGILKDKLQTFLNDYRPNSLSGRILNFFSLGYHRSETIKALDALCAQKSQGEIISLSEMVTEISMDKVHDSCKVHRKKLFKNPQSADNSGTDQVIKNIMLSMAPN
jgi:hypothetical protein